MAVDPIAFRIAGFQIGWNSVIFLVSIIISLLAVHFIAKYRQQKTDEVTNIFPFALIFGLLGARLLHVAVNWPNYFGYFPFFKSLISILDFRRGGLAVHGAILGVILALLVFCKIRKLNFWLWADIVAAGLILGQAFGKWIDYFSPEAFGKPTNLPWGIFINQGNRPLDYLNYEYFHPVFLYESIASLILFGIMIFMHRSYKNNPGKLPYGLIFSVYLGAYAVYTTIIEYYSLDSAYIGPVKAAYIINFFFLAAVIIIVSLVIKRFKNNKGPVSD